MITDVPWDDEVDLLVLGTGAGGLSAAVTAANEGLSTLVLEKTEFLGGTTAYSAGTCWIPGNRFQTDAGDADDARRYLDALVGDRSPRELREAYLAHGPAVIDYLDRLGVRSGTRARSSTTTRRSPERAPAVPSSRRRSTAGPSDVRTSAASAARCRSSRCSAGR